MKVEQIWIVTDPSPTSTLPDIMFGASFEYLAKWIKGGPSANAIAEEHPTMYTDETEARKDAEERLLKLQPSRDYTVFGVHPGSREAGAVKLIARSTLEAAILSELDYPMVCDGDLHYTKVKRPR